MAGNLSRCLVGILLLAASLKALDPNKRLTQYIHTSWRMQDGSAPSGMGAIAQTPDGFLWLSSYSGDLYRFDGIRFSSPVAPAKGASVSALRIFADHSGALWVFSRRELERVKDGVASHFKVAALGSPQSFSEASDGSLWVLNNNRDQPLCHVTGEVLRCFGKADGVPIPVIDSLLSDGNGGLWLGGETELVHWHSGVSELYPIEALKSNAGQEGLEALARGPDGSLWVGILPMATRQGLARFTGGAVKPFVTPALRGVSLDVNGLLFDHNGNLWVATNTQGIFRIRGNMVDHYGYTDGLSDDSVEALFEDREGMIWAVTSRGVDNFRDSPVVTFSALEGVAKYGGATAVIAAKDGSVWVGNTGSLDHLVNGSVLSIRSGHGLPGSSVVALFEDRASNLWVGVDDGLYLFKNGQFRRLPEPNHQPLGLIGGITEDNSGNIWAECGGNDRRLVRIQNFQVREQFSALQVPPGKTVAADPRGGIWIATRKGDIALFRNGAVQTQFPINPGGDASCHRISVQEDGSLLAGSEKGLVAWRRGQVQRMTTQNGLPCDRVVSFLQDKQKVWWLYMGCGIVSVADSEFQKWLANPSVIVQNRLYDVLDGVQPPLFPQGNPAARSSDGRLWFASGSIVQMIDPAALPQIAMPATTHIDSLTVDRKELAATQGLKLPPHPRDLRIDYTSPTYLIPQKVKFRYRLLPYDHDWNDAGTRRQAFYMDLAPGKYSFGVIASNSDGVWNDHAAQFDFTIQSAYYQTNWFRAAFTALALLLLWVAYRFRMRQLQQQFALALEARVAERNRIARDLHDTLLQSAHGLLLRFETVAQLLLQDRYAEAKLQLQNAIQQTADFITEARDEVQGLRDSTDQSHDLAMEISSLGESLAAGSPIAFNVTVEGEPKNLQPILRDEIYKICAEALRNAFQHSAGRHVEVEIRYDQHELRLRVRDDGKGIDPRILDTKASDGHFGLRGMRERATLIGGSLTVWSRIDAGAEVELRVPGAYSKTLRRWWFPRRRRDNGEDDH